MEYNTTRNHLVIREYGRNIQKMIEHAVTIPDRKKRSEVAQYIVQVMAQMNPQVKDIGEVKQKLWDHLFIISDFKLDIDSPFPPPTKEEINKKPERIPYKDRDITFRHYGKNIASIIEEAIKFPDGDEKDALVKTIANHLKKSYLTWNRESVDDSLITEHLRVLSDNRLKLNEEVQLNQTHEILARNKKKKNKKENSGRDNSRQRKDKR